MYMRKWRKGERRARARGPPSTGFGGGGEKYVGNVLETRDKKGAVKSQRHKGCRKGGGGGGGSLLSDPRPYLPGPTLYAYRAPLF